MALTGRKRLQKSGEREGMPESPCKYRKGGREQGSLGSGKEKGRSVREKKETEGSRWA